jgi:hypothetical protein
MSTILVRLVAPETRRTALRRTLNAPATAASAASVALPSTARALTRTTRAPAWAPPMPGRVEPDLTRIAIRMQPVSTPAPARSTAPSGARQPAVLPIAIRRSDRASVRCLIRQRLYRSGHSVRMSCQQGSPKQFPGPLDPSRKLGRISDTELSVYRRTYSGSSPSPGQASSGGSGRSSCCLGCFACLVRVAICDRLPRADGDRPRVTGGRDSGLVAHAGNNVP